MNLEQKNGVAPITGASSGLGDIYDDRFARRGYDLILAARDEARLKELSARLSSKTGQSVEVLRADLNDEADLAKVEAVLPDDPSITELVNNSGFASVAPLLDADVDQIEEIITLNVTALTRKTYAGASAFVAGGAGAIINVGSVVGISPETLNGRLRRDQGVRSCVQPLAAARTRLSRYPHPGGALRRNRNRTLQP